MPLVARLRANLSLVANLSLIGGQTEECHHPACQSYLIPYQRGLRASKPGSMVFM